MGLPKAIESAIGDGYKGKFLSSKFICKGNENYIDDCKSISVSGCGSGRIARVLCDISTEHYGTTLH